MAGLDVVYESRSPRREARGAIDRLWVIQADRCPTAVEGWIADASVQIYLNLGPGGRDLVGPQTRPSHRRAWVMGPHADPIQVVKETENSDIVAVRLRPAAAFGILGIPVHELRGQLVDLDLLWGTAVTRLRERLDTTSSAAGRLQILEDEIVDRWTKSVEQSDRWVFELCRALGRPNPRLVRELAYEFGVTHRRAITTFEERVGLRPKEFQRIQRIHSLLRSIDPIDPRWASRAYECGFADQSHMIREFRRLAGLTPGAYLVRRSPIGRECLRLVMARGSKEPAIKQGTTT